MSRERSVARCPELCFNNPYISAISNRKIRPIIEQCRVNSESKSTRNRILDLITLDYEKAFRDRGSGFIVQW